MYQNLARYYDGIFPAGENQLRFFKEEFQKHDVKTVLDLACGTGSYSLAFAGWGLEVVGVDCEEKMIHYARQKAARCNTADVRFLLGDMRKLPDLKKPFDAVVCIGNSLVHLLTDEDLTAALKEMHRLCKQGGLLVIQILNYDYIVDNSITMLPDIRNQEEGLVFTRQYQFRDDGLIEFTTSLILSKNKEEHILDAGSVLLRPLRPKQLVGHLEAAGFANCELYAGFDRSPVQNNRIPLVVKAYKK